MGKSKSDGKPLAIDRHERPWSSLRNTPMSGRGPPGPVHSAHPPWFCM